MYLARLFLGMPQSVSSSYGYVTGREVEDNAVAVLNYANGAVGIAEAGFVNPSSPFVIEIHGTKGSLLYSTHDNRLLVRSTELENKEWHALTDLPDSKESAFSQWVNHIKNETVASENIQMAVDLTTLMHASNLSAKAGKAIALDQLA